jgi:putative transposase
VEGWGTGEVGGDEIGRARAGGAVEVQRDCVLPPWHSLKYDRAAECLIKDREALLAFYDFPAEHWEHLRTTNVIESSFERIGRSNWVWRLEQ